VTRIPVNGIELNVEVSGEGRPLLLLHGFTGDTSTWAFLRAPEGVRTIAIDVIGHGASDAPADPERYSMAHAVRDLTAVLDTLDIEQTAVLGYSMGGRLALHFALNAPERLNALLLESASPGIEDASERAVRIEADDQLADSIERDGIEAFVDYWQALPLFASQSCLPVAVQAEQRRRRLRQSPRGMANSLRGMGAGRQDFLSARLYEIRAPTLLIAGALDQRYANLTETMGSLIKQARVEIVPGAGHAVHLEQPGIFETSIWRFLRDEG
jgi:2-succinyl-6-hydroxy-2,4-cyclohexadiene-1-carboxylate synthase